MLTGCFVPFLFYFVFAATQLFHFLSCPPNNAAELLGSLCGVCPHSPVASPSLSVIIGVSDSYLFGNGHNG